MGYSFLTEAKVLIGTVNVQLALSNGVFTDIFTTSIPESICWDSISRKNKVVYKIHQTFATLSQAIYLAWLQPVHTP